MRIIKPKKLQKGDLIGVISPASTPDDLSKIENGVNYLEKLGYRVAVAKNVGKERGYLAGEDSERLEDFHTMFSDKEVKAVFTLRGGYGSTRLLDKVNYNLIRQNPKIFVGYSDINALQLAILKMSGLVTFIGPMVATDFSGAIDKFAEEIFWNVLTSTKKIGKLTNPRNEKFFILCKGRGEGRIVGGNLSILTSLLGTEYFPNFKDSILILEEVNEAPYRIDRMLNQLKLAKVFRQSKGVLLGRFVDCYETDVSKKTLSLNEVISDYLTTLKKPVIYNVKHGHVSDTITIPLGVKCKINSSRGFIEILESGVC